MSAMLATKKRILPVRLLAFSAMALASDPLGIRLDGSVRRPYFFIRTIFPENSGYPAGGGKMGHPAHVRTFQLSTYFIIDETVK